MKTKSLTSGLLLIVTALAAHGASRSSTDYSIPAANLVRPAESARGLAQSQTWRLWLVCFCFLLSAFCFQAWGQSYSVDWYKIAGGGGTSTGATYQVSGTIGQSDAGGAMTGGNYSLTGGFWSLYSVIQTEGAPWLNLTQSNGYAILSWPSPSTDYGLEQTPALSRSSWDSVTNTPADNGTTKSVTLPMQPGNKFFRLKKP